MRRVVLSQCIIQNHASIVDMLCEFGADPDIRDANWKRPRDVYNKVAGPAVSAVLGKWARKRARENQGLLQEKHCYTCGKSAPDVHLKLCNRCHLVRYCSTECQSRSRTQLRSLCRSS